MFKSQYLKKLTKKSQFKSLSLEVKTTKKVKQLKNLKN